MVWFIAAGYRSRMTMDSALAGLVATLWIKKDRKRFLFSVQGNGSWDGAVR